MVRHNRVSGLLLPATLDLRPQTRFRTSRLWDRGSKVSISVMWTSANNDADCHRDRVPTWRQIINTDTVRTEIIALRRVPYLNASNFSSVATITRVVSGEKWIVDPFFYHHRTVRWIGSDTGNDIANGRAIFIQRHSVRYFPCRVDRNHKLSRRDTGNRGAQNQGKNSNLLHRIFFQSAQPIRITQ